MRHKLHLVLILTLSMVWLVLPRAVCLAETYYLNEPKGNDSWDGLAPEWDGDNRGPWETMTKAKSTVQPGDVILLRDGNYGTVQFGSSDSSGTNWSNKITYKADTEATPIFSRLEFLSTTKDWYIEFDGITIEITDTGFGITLRSSAHLRFLNFTIKSTVPEWEVGESPSLPDKGVAFVANNRFEDILIEGCEITRVRRGIQIQGDIGDGVVIRNNELHFLASSAIRLITSYNANILIDGNHIYNQVPIAEAHGTGISIRSSNLTIRNNIVHNFGNSSSIRTYDLQPHGPYHDLLFENNLVYDPYNYANPVWIVQYSDNIVFRNNTIVGLHYGTSGASWYRTPLKFDYPQTSAGGFELYNNVIVGTVYYGRGASHDAASGNIMWSHNDNGVWKSELVGNIIVNPGNSSQPDYFESPGSFFAGSANFTYELRHGLNLNDAFKLAAGSPAIGFADPAHAPETDILGNLRDAAPDAGCYEYGTYSPSPQPPIADAGLDQTITDKDRDGSEEVTLDGSGSRDPDGTIVSFIWSEGGLQIATGINPTVILSTGIHLITLIVTDNEGLTDTDIVTVKVLKEDKEFGELPTGCYNNVINPLKGEKAIIMGEIEEQGCVKISLYDTKGKKIRELADEERDAGPYKYYWDGKDDSGNIVGSGLYFVHIQAGDYRKTKKIVVVK